MIGIGFVARVGGEVGAVAEAAAYKSSTVKSIFVLLATVNANLPMGVVSVPAAVTPAGNVPGASIATLLAKTAKVPEASEVDTPLSGRV